MLRLIEPTSGTVKVLGEDIAPLSKKELRPFRQQMQIVFQDPFSSLNPRMTAGDIVGEPLYVHGVKGRKERLDQVAALFERVGLRPAQMVNSRTSSRAASASASASPARSRSGPS